MEECGLFSSSGMSSARRPSLRDRRALSIGRWSHVGAVNVAAGVWRLMFWREWRGRGH